MIKNVKRVAYKVLPYPMLDFARRLRYARRFVANIDEIEPDAKIVRHLVHPGDIAIDVGANLGLYTRLLSFLTSTNGKVYSLEPVPGTYAILASNVRRADLKNVELINCAVSSQDQTVVIEIPIFDTGGESYYDAAVVPETHINTSLRHFRVEAKTLDTLFADKLNRVQLIKCDIEGYELACLQGATRLVEKFHPIWLIEVKGDPGNAEMPAYKTFEWLTSKGYKPFYFADGKLVEWHSPELSLNYFFLTKTHVETFADLLKDRIS